MEVMLCWPVVLLGVGPIVGFESCLFENNGYWIYERINLCRFVDKLRKAKNTKLLRIIYCGKIYVNFLTHMPKF